MWRCWRLYPAVRRYYWVRFDVLRIVVKQVVLFYILNIWYHGTQFDIPVCTLSRLVVSAVCLTDSLLESSKYNCKLWVYLYGLRNFTASTNKNFTHFSRFSLISFLKKKKKEKKNQRAFRSNFEFSELGNIFYFLSSWLKTWPAVANSLRTQIFVRL